MRTAQCQNNMRQFGIAAQAFSTQKQRLPTYTSFYGLFPGGADPANPGLGAIPAHVKVSGFGVPLLPHLDQQALFDRWSTAKYPVISTTGPTAPNGSGFGWNPNSCPTIPVFQCPSNTVRNGSLGANSYVCNTGSVDSGLDRNGNPLTNVIDSPGTPGAAFVFARSENNSNGVFKIGFPTASTTAPFVAGNKMTMEDIQDGQSQTALYSENIQAFSWYRPGFLNGPDLANLSGQDLNWGAGYSQDGSVSLAQAYYRGKFTNGMVWHRQDPSPPEVAVANPGYGPVSAVTPVHKINGEGSNAGSDRIDVLRMNFGNCRNLARPASMHPELVNVTMADGAVKPVSETIDYRVYQAMLTPHGVKSNVPFPEFVLTNQLGE
jgi:hypothetical protein